VGNFPALESPGPRRRGICLIKASEARKASYFLASFLTSFLFLLSFLRSSTDMYCEGKGEGQLCGPLASEQDQETHLELDELGTIDIESIGENADRHARAGEMGEPVRMGDVGSASGILAWVRVWSYGASSTMQSSANDCSPPAEPSPGPRATLPLLLQPSEAVAVKIRLLAPLPAHNIPPPPQPARVLRAIDTIPTMCRLKVVMRYNALLDGSRETLVTLGVVVLETDLELNLKCREVNC